MRPERPLRSKTLREKRRETKAACAPGQAGQCSGTLCSSPSAELSAFSTRSHSRSSSNAALRRARSLGESAGAPATGTGLSSAGAIPGQSVDRALSVFTGSELAGETPRSVLWGEATHQIASGWQNATIGIGTGSFAAVETQHEQVRLPVAVGDERHGGAVGRDAREAIVRAARERAIVTVATDAANRAANLVRVEENKPCASDAHPMVGGLNELSARCVHETRHPVCGKFLRRAHIE